MRVGAHAPNAFGCKFLKFRNECAAGIEQFLRPVTLHPVFEQLDVFRLGRHLGQRDLM
jgi:hypothetical protein